MRRRWWYRPFSVLFTLWFPLVLGEPSLLQPCPMHGAVVSASQSHQQNQHQDEHQHAAPATATVDHSDHSDHAVRATHADGVANAAANSAASNQDQAPGHQHHQCTCIGCCVGSVAAVLAPTPHGALYVSATYQVANRLPTAESLPRPAPEHARPFTTGPPRA